MHFESLEWTSNRAGASKTYITVGILGVRRSGGSIGSVKFLGKVLLKQNQVRKIRSM